VRSIWNECLGPRRRRPATAFRRAMDRTEGQNNHAQGEREDDGREGSEAFGLHAACLLAADHEPAETAGQKLSPRIDHLDREYIDWDLSVNERRAPRKIPLFTPAGPAGPRRKSLEVLRAAAFCSTSSSTVLNRGHSMTSRYRKSSDDGVEPGIQPAFGGRIAAHEIGVELGFEGPEILN